jgi:ribosomal protein L44E
MKDNIKKIAENLPKFKFKKDSYMKKRGAPALLILTCANCQEYLISYQKDGPGPLLRCYLDRILHPEEINQRQKENFDKQSALALKCTACQTVIGSPTIYEKEDRPAYHLRQGFFSMAIIKP